MRALLFVLLAINVGTAAIASQLAPLFTYKDYPAEAVRHNWQGDVTVILTVSPTGRVTDCKIVKSSGFKVLDDATCKVFIERAKFAPAKGADGTPIESQVTPRPIGWHLYP